MIQCHTSQPLENEVNKTEIKILTLCVIYTVVIMVGSVM